MQVDVDIAPQFKGQNEREVRLFPAAILAASTPNARTFLLVYYVHTIQESTNSRIGDANSLRHAPPELELQL